MHHMNNGFVLWYERLQVPHPPFDTAPLSRIAGQKDENHVHTEFWNYILVVFNIKCITFHLTDFTLFFS
jgi:hypothetical protein